jgi:hypothetical protein
LINSFKTLKKRKTSPENIDKKYSLEKLWKKKSEQTSINTSQEKKRVRDKRTKDQILEKKGNTIQY